MVYFSVRSSLSFLSSRRLNTRAAVGSQRRGPAWTRSRSCLPSDLAFSAFGFHARTRKKKHQIRRQTALRVVFSSYGICLFHTPNTTNRVQRQAVTRERREGGINSNIKFRGLLAGEEVLSD